MAGIKQIAGYIIRRYKSEFGHDIDEMKLQKLLYFTQRESMIKTYRPITSARFEAWKHGPVSATVHRCYSEGLLTDTLSEEEAERYRDIFDSVFSTYAGKKSWSLCSLSHGELSWQNARGETPPDKNSHNVLKIEDIEKDADRVRLRRFLLS